MTASSAIEKHLDVLRACRRCPDMLGGAVVGRPVDSRVYLVGQAPGDKEPKLGRPFAWTAGKTLFKWFGNSLGWTEDETRTRIYFAAVCRCFPGKRPEGGDRVPSPKEISECARWMEKEFALLRPELVLPVGKLAIGRFLPEPLPPLTELIGRCFSVECYGRKVDVIPLPHPSGASPWHRTEPGVSLLRRALEKVAEHPALRSK